MWKSPYLPHFKPKITDLLLSCIRLFVESDVLLQSGIKHWIRVEEEKAERAAPPTIQAPPEHVQKIMDMGFTRENVEEALRKCENNQEQATEWLVQKKKSVRHHVVESLLHTSVCHFSGGGGGQWRPCLGNPTSTSGHHRVGGTSSMGCMYPHLC